MLWTVLLYADTYPNLHGSDASATNLQQEMEYSLFILAVQSFVALNTLFQLKYSLETC